MYRRNIVGISALVVGLAMVPGGAGAQQKSIKAQVVGAWTLLLADNVKDDGTHVPGYGPNPEGLLVFMADGHYSLQIVRYGRPAFASKDRLAGTPAENKTPVQGMISHFGKYTRDEGGTATTFRIAARSFPDRDAPVQRR